MSHQHDNKSRCDNCEYFLKQYLISKMGYCLLYSEDKPKEHKCDYWQERSKR